MMDDDGMVNGTRTNGTDFVSVELSLTVGYQVESTSNDTEDYVLELELRLLETAVLAALGGCSGVDDTGGGGGGRALQYVETMGHRRLTNAETLVVGTFFGNGIIVLCNSLFSSHTLVLYTVI